MTSLKTFLRVLLRPMQSVPPPKREVNMDRLVAQTSRGNVNLMLGRYIDENEAAARRARVTHDESDFLES